MTARDKKGVILFIVLATIMLVVTLSGVMLSLISSHSRQTHHQVSRIRAQYAVRGMMNYALEQLRTGAWQADPAVPGAVRYACHRACLDGQAVFAPGYVIPTDADIPYNVMVAIHPRNAALGNTVTQIDIKTDYTYTP